MPPKKSKIENRKSKISTPSWRRIRLFAMDVDGILTDGTVQISSELKSPHLIQGRTDKLAALQELATQLKLSPAECAYMGDDDIDAPAIAWAGIGLTVPGAMPAALQAARLVTRRTAGHGAVREICELLLAARVGR